MKLFTNKQFRGEIEKALAPIKQENEKLREIIDKKEYDYLVENDDLKGENKQLNEIILLREEEIKRLENLISELNEKYKKVFGAKGGLTKYVNRLEKKLEDKEKELVEANKKLSQRYIVKELKPDKVKNTQVAKIKSGSVTSKIIKKVVEDE